MRTVMTPELDPDYAVHAKDDWDFLKNSMLRRQPAGPAQKAYGDTRWRVSENRIC